MKKQRSSLLTVAVLSLMAVALASLFEIGAAVCASAPVFAAYGFLWTLILLPFLLRRPSIAKYAFYVLLMISLAILYFVPWNSRKPFLRDLERVQIGMTVAEVESIMGEYLKGTGWPALPGTASSNGQLMEVGSGITMTTSDSFSGELAIEDSIVYRHSIGGAFNSDWGVVMFKEARVVRKTFMPD